MDKTSNIYNTYTDNDYKNINDFTNYKARCHTEKNIIYIYESITFNDPIVLSSSDTDLSDIEHITSNEIKENNYTIQNNLMCNIHNKPKRICGCSTSSKNKKKKLSKEERRTILKNNIMCDEHGVLKRICGCVKKNKIINKKKPKHQLQKLYSSNSIISDRKRLCVRENKLKYNISDDELQLCKKHNKLDCWMCGTILCDHGLDKSKCGNCIILPIITVRYRT